MKATTEKAFEAYIEENMSEKRGWIAGSNLLWDKQKALFPEYVISFIQDTQGDLWKQMEKLHGAELSGKLIDTLAPLVFADVGGVAVTAPAVLRGVFARDANLKAAAGVHGHIPFVLFRVAAMAIGATDSIFVVDVILIDEAHAFLHAVAFEAGVLGGPSSRGGEHDQKYR